MRATIKDAYSALTLRNCVAMAVIIAASVFSIDLVGYSVWRRFVLPSVIIGVAVMGWKIARLIAEAGLSRIINAASTGLVAFGLTLYLAALIDGLWFADRGYFSFTIMVLMWSWIAFHLYRALKVLKQMSPERRSIVTESTAVIYAQMTYREQQSKEVLDRYDKEVRRLKLVSR